MINYNDLEYLPNFAPENEGFSVTNNHFYSARMKPDILYDKIG